MKVFSTQSEKLLSWMFGSIVYGFKTIGLAPVSFHTNTNVFLPSKIGLFYNLVLSTLTLIMGAVKILNMVFPVHSRRSYLNRILNIGHYMLILFTAWFEIVYWAFKQKKAAHIVNRLLDVHCLLSAPKKQLSNKRMLIFLAMHVTFSILVWIIFVVSAQILFNSLLAALAVTTPIFVNYCFLVEYSMVLGFIARELESLNANLLSSKYLPHDSFLTFLPSCNLSVLGSPTHNQLADIKLLHSARTTLYEVSQDVADFFSLPILPSILLFFYMTVYIVYYIIISALLPDHSPSLDYYISSAAWLVIGIYPMILLCSYVTKTTKEAQLTGKLVHKLLAMARRREIKTEELEHFSLHLIHEKVSFTAYGFFTLDFTLLQSIFGATATYLVIIIQFVLQSTET